MKTSGLSPAAIEITGLSKVYPVARRETVTAVDNLNLVVETGQVFGFLGANGAGKTTTIKMMCGLVTPTTGQVRIGGHDVLRERRAAMYQIGAVLEGTRNVYWRLTAWQNLMYFGHLKGCWGKELKAHAKELLGELDLWGRRNDPIRTFSRGMQQKVAIACALIGNPSIVLLDEPTLGLDIQAARTVKEWIQRLTKEQGKTVVLTTHQLDMAEELCDRVAIIRKGCLLTNRPLAELLHLFRQEHYQIRLKGDVQNVDWFEGLTIATENDETTLTGSIADQSILYTYLNTIHSHDLPLLSVTRVQPNLEEIFVQLLDGGEQILGEKEKSASEGEKGEQHEHLIASYVQ
ncbi:MAG: ABC transporter ATP-binding protein [Ktedonobacteraceae bacterium]